MTVVQTKYDSKNRPTFYFKDGSALKLMTEAITAENPTTTYRGARDWTFYTMDPDKCVSMYGSEDAAVGKCGFMFLYIPKHHTTWGVGYHLGKGFEPYKYEWNGNKNFLYTSKRYGCNSSSAMNAYCTSIIQLNGWKIPKDYPYKVR